MVLRFRVNTYKFTDFSVTLHVMGKFYDELCKDYRFREGLKTCINCGTCTAICPAAEFYKYDPRKIVDTVQRKDDAPETVLSRLDVYEEKTAPLKDYYWETGKLVTVEGQEEVADTTRLVFEALGIEG